jgi:hypothetical protein
MRMGEGAGLTFWGLTRNPQAGHGDDREACVFIDMTIYLGTVFWFTSGRSS